MSLGENLGKAIDYKTLACLNSNRLHTHKFVSRGFGVWGPGTPPNEALAEAIMAHCRQHLAGVKCPRRVDFTDRLPREANGKLYKRHLIAEYEKAAQH